MFKKGHQMIQLLLASDNWMAIKLLKFSKLNRAVECLKDDSIMEFVDDFCLWNTYNAL